MGRKLPEAQRATFQYLCDEFHKYNCIEPDDWTRYDVKRGLRNQNGTGVLAGLTSICDVVGYELADGQRVPCDGRLLYRGIDVAEIAAAGKAEGRSIFEEVVWLLLFGDLPSEKQLQMFRSLMAELRVLPENFAEDMIIKWPSRNIMNKMAQAVLSMYSYDDAAEDMSLENSLYQAIGLISFVPTIMADAYQVKRWAYDKKSMYFHQTKPELSTAENILRTARGSKRFEPQEARLLDLCLALHADHGGGNNSTFTARVVTSTGTDIYSAISAAIGSLKGPRHGGANLKVMEMLDDMSREIRDAADDEEIAAYLRRLLAKQAGDRSGLIYGIGHAVYTKSDPRCVILRQEVQPLAVQKGLEREFLLLSGVERLAPALVREEKGMNSCANVDLYSGLVYRTMNIPEELFTPLFACARMAGWCAHRVEEMEFGKRIIRPAYKYLGEERRYTPLDKR